MILAYAGRRPSTGVHGELPDAALPGLAARVGRLLDALCPCAVVGAAAAGADLIVLEAALARGCPAEVVLPADRAAFRATSVADVDGLWGPRYDRAIAAPGVDVREHDVPGPGAQRYLDGNGLVLDRAAELGAGASVVALGVFEAARDGEDVTAAFLCEARRRGLATLRLGPGSGAVQVRAPAAAVNGVLAAEAGADEPSDLLDRLRELLGPAAPGGRHPGRRSS